VTVGSALLGGVAYNMQHIFKMVDRIMVLRRGKLVTVRDVHDVSSDDIVKCITGSEEVIVKM
jgi:ABC-type sugar transport system ATPase subunit